MSFAFLKLTHQWFLAGCLTLTPIFGAVHLEGAALNDYKCTEPKAQQQFVENLEKLVIDFHDNTLLGFWNGTFEYPGSILINDALNIGLIINSMNPIHGPAFAGLLVNFYSAGSDYAQNLGNGNLCTFPNNGNELISNWLSAGKTLADFINSKSFHTPKETVEINKLFLEWTNAQITYLKNAAPQCSNPSIPVNAALSAAAYARARSLTYFIALEVFKTFENM